LAKIGTTAFWVSLPRRIVRSVARAVLKVLDFSLTGWLYNIAYEEDRYDRYA